MATPVVAGTATTTGNKTSPFSLNLPSSISSGDTLLMMLTRGNTSGETFTFPAGWTQLGIGDVGANDTSAVFVKTATGSEGSTVSVTCSITDNQPTPSVCYRMTGALSVECATPVSSSGTSPTGGTVTPSWGSATNLYIWCFGWNGNFDLTSYPSGYTGSQSKVGFGGTAVIAAATYANTSSSENIPAGTLAGSESWAAFSLAVKPTPLSPSSQAILIM